MSDIQTVNLDSVKVLDRASTTRSSHYKPFFEKALTLNGNSGVPVSKPAKWEGEWDLVKFRQRVQSALQYWRKKFPDQGYEGLKAVATQDGQVLLIKAPKSDAP